MAKYIFVNELAEKVGVQSQTVRRHVRKDGVKTVKMPRVTDGGLKECIAVPAEYANSLIAKYEAARRNTEGGEIESVS